jgi:hypothetical protein
MPTPARRFARSPAVAYIIVIVALVVGLGAYQRTMIHDAQTTVTTALRRECANVTQSRFVGAQRAAVDIMRETALADAPGEAAHAEHLATATVALKQLGVLLRLAGMNVTLEPREIIAYDPGNQVVHDRQRAYCRRAFP